MSNFKYEVERLNKTVNELRAKLFESEAENQKLKLELECVLELLKKAWSGDRIASMHITNILNNAEVSNLKLSGTTNTNRQAAADKSQRDALLRSRNEYLNQEFIKTVTTMGSMPVSCNTTATLSRPSSSVLRRPMSTSGSRSSTRALGVSRRAQSAVGGDRRSLSVQGGGEQFELTTQTPERLELLGLRPTNTSVRYDDPSRYMKDGLFSPKTTDLTITGRSGNSQTVPFVHTQGLQPNGSPRVHAAQVVAARRLGRTPPVPIAPGASRRPPSGILAIQDRPLKTEVQYYESSLQPRRVQSGRHRENSGSASEVDASSLTNARPKTSGARGIRFADDVDVLPLSQDNGDQQPTDDSQPSEERKRRVTVAIQRRIGISDNAIVVPR